MCATGAMGGEVVAALLGLAAAGVVLSLLFGALCFVGLFVLKAAHGTQSR